MSQFSHTPSNQPLLMAQAARRRRPSGQTLAEISVIVTVLMILGGALLPVIADSISSARVVRARHEAALVAAAFANYQRDHGQPLLSLASTLPVPHVTDPWGHQLLVNLDVLRGAHGDVASAGEYAVFVISAGPNGRIETPFVQERSTARAYGDDVIVRIQ